MLLKSLAHEGGEISLMEEEGALSVVALPQTCSIVNEFYSEILRNSSPIWQDRIDGSGRRFPYNLTKGRI